MVTDIKKIIKAVLLSTSEAVGIRDIQILFKEYRRKAQEDLEKAEREDRSQFEEALKAPEFVTAGQVREAIEEINEALEGNEDVYRIIQDAEGYRLVVVGEYSPWVRIYRNDDKPLKLSSALLETLALVAYRQQITRAEMELVRGVSVDNAINKLLEYDLIVVQGQANLPGKPRLYGTTTKFLNFCGIQSLADLPTSDILSPEQIDKWLEEVNTRERYTEQDLGLLPAEEMVSSGGL